MWTGGTDEEYETQHFGFGSQRLKIAVRQMIEQKITNGVKDFESYLQESLELNDKDKATLTRSCDKLIRLYFDRTGPSLDAIDGEIERILKVPSNVLLPGDECQVNQISDSEYEKLRDEISSLRKRVERGALMDALLAAEEQELSTMDNVCEAGKKDMEVFDLVSKNCDDGTNSLLKDTVTLCSSANFLKKCDYENTIFES